MQYKLTFSLSEPLVLPLSHHHILQGFIYHVLSQHPTFSQQLHDHGFSNDGFAYKLFCFGLLQGRFHVKKPHIIFYDAVTLEVRSPIPEFNCVWEESLRVGCTYQLGNQKIHLLSIEKMDKKITSTSIRIQMNSPLCASKTYYENDKKLTQYSTPSDSDFLELIRLNHAKKYKAAYRTLPIDTFTFSIDKISPRDKYVTKFKDSIYITAWRGIYLLEGSPETLTFLYNTGLGSRNSQGFGMFDLYH